MSTERPIVYVIDDDGTIRSALRRLLLSLNLNPRLFASAKEFMSAAFSDVPSCIVSDIRLPGMSGLDLQEQLKGTRCDLPIIFITGYADIRMTVQAMKAGAVEFLPKPFRDQDLVDAVHRAIEKDRAVRAYRRDLNALQQRYETLTEREKSVLPLLLEGLLNKQIAAQLGTSEKTIKRDRGHLMKKMNASSIAELVKLAHKLRQRP